MNGRRLVAAICLALGLGLLVGGRIVLRDPLPALVRARPASAAQIEAQAHAGELSGIIPSVASDNTLWVLRRDGRALYASGFSPASTALLAAEVPALATAPAWAAHDARVVGQWQAGLAGHLLLGLIPELGGALLIVWGGAVLATARWIAPLRRTGAAVAS